jgi:SAM-dependent methyltransferase/translation elongation factor EF-1beta
MESSAASSVGKELEALGDPSGRQDSHYWDEWFRVVCQNDDKEKVERLKPFEWYCSAEEVSRVLSFHLGNDNNIYDTDDRPRRRMIHPGSGTSLVPLKLGEAFPEHQHVIVDVSQVAVEQIQQIHAAKRQGNGHEASNETRIAYRVCDLLDPPLPFETSSFDAWVDKGFFDAIFSDNNEQLNRDQSRKLFGEANRILTNEVAVALIISLAEDHSLRLIVDRWLDGEKEESTADPSSSLTGWARDLHIWELEPISGTMRPFGFVLRKSKKATESERIVVWHAMDRTVTEHPCASSLSVLLQLVQTLVLDSRQEFVQKKSTDDACDGSRREVLLTLEIKPYDTSVDMFALGERLCASDWTTDSGTRDLRPRWQPFKDSRNDNQGVLCKVVPIGYGICKLLLQCVIASEDVDDLVECLQEWEGDQDCEDGIQSVDVDWAMTVPVGDAARLAVVKRSR